MGLSIPQELCRRVGLYQHSIQSKIALAIWSRVSQRCSSSSSSCSEPKKLSATLLSKQSPIERIEPSDPAAGDAGRTPTTCTGPRDRLRDRLTIGWLSPPDRHLQRVDDELGRDVTGDRCPPPRLGASAVPPACGNSACRDRVGARHAPEVIHTTLVTSCGYQRSCW